MSATRAVLFDFGGTLYDYRCFAKAEVESLTALAGWVGLSASAADMARAQRHGMKTVFARYRELPFYFHRDLFDDGLRATLAAFGVSADDALLARYRKLQWDSHARDFVLRPKVRETLTELRRRGHALGIVSNIDDDQLAHLLDVAGVRDCFDWAMSSEEARSCKPDSGIFREALRRAGCAPAEALFVGDSLFHDVAGANRLGMRTALIWHAEGREPSFEIARPTHVVREFAALLELAP